MCLACQLIDVKPSRCQYDEKQTQPFGRRPTTFDDDQRRVNRFEDVSASALIQPSTLSDQFRAIVTRESVMLHDLQVHERAET